MAGKTFIGIVTSTKMDKTLVVSAERQFQETRTGKIVSSKKKYKVHYEAADVSEGDQVLFTECRPISKQKKFRFLKTIRKAEKVLA
ncbi:30S ribosomal protein S17 [bacterium]|nr:30S ribosomal protein S17 [bacterium]